jgi:hypothetical protein
MKELKGIKDLLAQLNGKLNDGDSSGVMTFMGKSLAAISTNGEVAAYHKKRLNELADKAMSYAHDAGTGHGFEFAARLFTGYARQLIEDLDT